MDLNVLVDTQRKIVGYFSGASDDMSILIRDGLMRLIDDVLFLEDPDRPGIITPVSRLSIHMFIIASMKIRSLVSIVCMTIFITIVTMFFGKTRRCGSYLLSYRRPTCWSVVRIWE